MLLTWHLPIKAGLVRGAEGVGDSWWCIGNHQVKQHHGRFQRHKCQRGEGQRNSGVGRKGVSSRTGRDPLCSCGEPLD